MSDSDHNSDPSKDDHSLFGFLKAKISQTLSMVPFSQEIESRIHEGIEKALVVLNVPTKDEVDQLHDRIDQLVSRCDDLLKHQKNP